TLARSRPAYGRALAVRGAGRTVPRAVVRQVADPGRSAALECARLERVRRTGVRHPIATLSDVAVARRRPAHRRALSIRGAGRTVPRAVVRQVADPGRSAALECARLERVRRTGVRHPIAT